MEKYTPSKIVKNNPWVACERFLSIKAWWAHVTVTPEDKRIAVLRRGIWNGLNGWTLIGGQRVPISMAGERLLWKNAQKNERKKKISEMINKIIPHRRPVVTG